MMINIFKLLKYSLKFKTNMVAMALILVLGLVLYVLEPNGWLPYFYLQIPGLFVVQMGHYLAACDMVKSSACQYRIQVMFPALMSIASMGILYTITVGLSCLRYVFLPREEIGFEMFFMIALVLLFTISYFGISYKLFWLAMILLFGTLLPLIMGFQIMENMETPFVVWLSDLPPVVPVLSGYAAILIGSLVEYLLLKAFYRKPYSKFAYGAVFKKA